MDVSSLYTNIPHSDGIRYTVEACQNADMALEINEHALTTLLDLVLRYNYFQFENKHYLQISGTAMGTKMAPNYANLFMAALEGPFLEAQPVRPLIYKRFLDDIFFVWPHDEASLHKFISDFNAVHPSISFTHNISRTSVNFLDVTIQVEGTTTITALYRKPTDRQQYLHFESDHPRHCKMSIPYSQAHRYRRICSDNADFDHNSQQLKNALIRQKYPAAVVDDSINRARNLNREEILHGGNPRNEGSQTNLVLTHSSALPKLNNILSRHFNILQQSSRLSSIFQKPPRVVYRRGKNLKDMLVRAKTTAIEGTQRGCQPCKKTRCKVCSHMTTTTTAKASSSDYVFKINAHLNCDSQNVVYMLHCDICGMQYIGQTETAFRKRFNNHRSHAKTQPNLPISRHVSLPGHSFDQIKVTLLETGFHTKREREQKESYLIYKFKTLTHGINESAGSMSCLRRTTDVD